MLRPRCNLFAIYFIVTDWRSLRLFGMRLWSPINLWQDQQLVSDWSETYRQLLTVHTAICLRSVETGRRTVGEWSVTGCNWAVTGRWLTADRFSMKTKANKIDAFHNRTVSLQVFKMLTTGLLQLLRMQRVNQNAAFVAKMVYRRLIRRGSTGWDLG